MDKKEKFNPISWFIARLIALLVFVSIGMTLATGAVWLFTTWGGVVVLILFFIGLAVYDFRSNRHGE